MFDDGISPLQMLAFAVPATLTIFALMYFNFKTRPATVFMWFASILTALIASLVATIALLLLMILFEDSKPHALLGYAIGCIPICYLTAYLACVVVFIIDTLRLKANAFRADPPDIFFGYFWTLDKIAVALVGLPILALTFSVVVVEAGKQWPNSSVLSLTTRDDNGRTFGRNFALLYPSIFPLNETTSVRITDAPMRSTFSVESSSVSCSLAAPDFDVQTLSIVGAPSGGASGQLKDSLAYCGWLLTARHSGVQTLIVKIGVMQTDPSKPSNETAVINGTFVESVRVVGEPYTLRSLIIVILFTSVAAGLILMTRLKFERSSGFGLPHYKRRRSSRTREPDTQQADPQSELFQSETKTS